MTKDSKVGHRKRIRENYLSGGIKGWQEYQILELLLTYAIPRKDVKEIAKNLIDRHKNIFNILNADKDALMKVKGVGPETAVFLKLMRDIVQKVSTHNLENYDVLKDLPTIKTKTVLLNYLKSEIAFENEENFMVLFLNNANRLVGMEKLFCGTIDKSAVYPREVVRYTIKHKAKGVIFAHNHPSGSVRPSRADLELTEHLSKVLGMLDIIVLDHVIVSRGSYYSFLEEGLI